eukprot:TRINITY_DN2938_c0_g1_i1.p1 TRINITY_DN2938_c0_g1~~TRINITY_DN2938_c0_g1_i1.p1  ORF type:complete len:1669 (+),score=425.84 TRINITY_DN2938_c0_g1_i1:1354-6360(+)
MYNHPTNNTGERPPRHPSIDHPRQHMGVPAISVHASPAPPEGHKDQVRKASIVGASKPSPTTVTTLTNNAVSTTTPSATPSTTLIANASEYILTDLFDHYDEGLLHRFNREMVLRNYKHEDHQPLHDWLRALSPEGRGNPHIPDLHMLIAFKNNPESQSKPHPRIKGGIIFEFYPTINCGLFNYLIIKRKHRNKGLDNLLVKRAIEILNDSAQSRGHLAGVNAIFFETKSAHSVAPHQQDVLDPRHQHAVLHQMGFRLLDFDYVQLPLARLGKLKSLLLTVFLTPHIPAMPHPSGGNRYYLPNVLLKGFIVALWDNAYATARIPYRPEDDPEFRRTLDQIELREKIPLLDLPWGAGKPWTLVDMWEDYDEELLERCYHELMFPLHRSKEEDLDSSLSLPFLKRSLSVAGRDDEHVPDVHVLMAIKWPQDNRMMMMPLIDAVVVFEYHPNNNCGLISLLLLQRRNRVDGLDSLLIDTTLDILDQNAKERGNIAGCNAIFLEAKLSQQAAYNQDIIDISQHHIVLHKMGFRLLDCEYVRPTNPIITTPGSSPRGFGRLTLDPGAQSTPYGSPPSSGVVVPQLPMLRGAGMQTPPKPAGLCVFLTPLIPLMRFEKGDKYYLPNPLLRYFVEDQWACAHGAGLLKAAPTSYASYHRMVEQIELREKIPLLDLPWVGGKPWTLVDLWEDYDEDLLMRFYKELMIPNFPIKHELEPYETLLQALSDESREDPDISDLHVVLALRWPSDNISMLATNKGPIIEGGIIFEYFPSNNCGLLTYLTVHKNFKGQGLDKALVETALEVLNQNAKVAGYLPGCNAIFLEVSSAEKATLQQDIADVRTRHAIYHEIGFRLLEFEYVSPPLSPSYPKLKHLLLTVYITPHIPTMPLEDDKYYLPSSVLQNFMEVLWASAFSAGRLSGPPEHDLDFIRSLEQIDLREKIPLLDLPWGASKPWTLVDLWEDYDEELLVRFYNELMLPNFPIKHELEPLDNFMAALSEERRTGSAVKQSHQQSEFHVLLAIKWPSVTEMDQTNNNNNNNNNSNNPAPSPAPSVPYSALTAALAPSTPATPSPAHTPATPATPSAETRAASTPITPSEKHPPSSPMQDAPVVKPTLGGGITFEYFPATNCGLLTYLIVHRSTRGQGLAGILVERAVHLLEQIGKRRGQLSGCNAIFLETNSAEKITVNQDVMDPRMRHTIYHKMGFRLLDFEYVMPPLSLGWDKLKGVLLLTVYLTPHIPWIPLNSTHTATTTTTTADKDKGIKRASATSGKYYYLPSVLLRNFISSQWMHSFVSKRLGTRPDEDSDFRSTIEQIELREKIPLLDLPWGDGKDWLVVNMWGDYDQELLDAFYHKYMVTHFGTSDELEPLENWHKMLSLEGRNDPNICDLHVLLALALPGEHKGKRGHKYIMGGLVFEYYPPTNTALVTYIVVGQKWSNKGIGSDLLRRALTILDHNAKEKGHIAGCNAIFLEANFVEDGFETYQMSHDWLNRRGFRLVDFEYFQPPTYLKNPVAYSVCLTVLLTPRIPLTEGDAGVPYLPSNLLRGFITTLWQDECGLINYDYTHDPKYLYMLKQLDETDRFSCLELPWTRARIIKPISPFKAPAFRRPSTPNLQATLSVSGSILPSSTRNRSPYSPVSSVRAEASGVPPLSLHTSPGSPIMRGATGADIKRSPYI